MQYELDFYWWLWSFGLLWGLDEEGGSFYFGPIEPRVGRPYDDTNDSIIPFDFRED